MRIWTEKKGIYIQKDEDGGYLISDIAKMLRFKAEHITAKADPELFELAAGIIEEFCSILEDAEKHQKEEQNEKPEEKTSPVNHPAHYNHGSIETIDYIESLDLGYGFCVGNAIKYLSRAAYKGNMLEDLKKAEWYVDRVIKEVEEATK